MALGIDSADVFRLVLIQGCDPTLLRLLAGLLAALAVSRVMRSQLLDPAAALRSE